MSTVYLDGVCCLGKTTLLKELEKEGYTVAFTDYCEFKEKFEQFLNIGNPFYTQWHRIKSLGMQYVDRSPLANLLYACIFANEPPELFDELLSNLEVSENIVVMLPMPSSFHRLLEKMIERNNGIDILDISYIQKQYDVFQKFATKFNLKTFVIDYNEELDSQFKFVLDELKTFNI